METGQKKDERSAGIRGIQEVSQIYVVEDDDNIREIEEYVLKNAGYDVKGYSISSKIDSGWLIPM